jgi:cytoskeleton protein RodZ
MVHGDGRAVSDGEGAEREPSIGERLRVGREAQPLSLTQIAAELRIELKFLEALEDDRLDAFPAPVFAKGFLRQYGGLLGLDERDLIAQYYRQAEVRDAPMLHHKPIRLRDENKIRHWLAAALVLVVLTGGAAVWWTAQPDIEPIAVERTTEPSAALPTPTPVQGQAPVPESRPEPQQEVASAAALDEGPTTTTTAEASVAEVGPAAIGPAPAGTLIELNFIEDCWTEISDARGERLFYGLGSAGARSRFNADLPVAVLLGNAAGVEISVDGDRYPIPADGRQGNRARFVIAEPGL